MRELRRVAGDPCVESLLVRVSACLVEQLELFRASQGCSSALKASLPYRHGIDIRSWASSCGAGPPRSYMELVEISVPLTFAAQAATYLYSMLHAPPSPHHPHRPPHHSPSPTRLLAALGHSQGMAAAAVAAAAGSSAQEFVAWAEAAAAHLFWLGLRIAEAAAVARGRPDCAHGPWSLGVGIRGIRERMERGRGSWGGCAFLRRALHVRMYF